MAINQVLGTSKAIRINDTSVLGLVSSFDWSPNFNAEDIQEMGNSTKLDTAMDLETSGSFELESCGNTAGLLARMALARDVSGNFTGYTYAANSANINNYTFTQDDLSELRFDLLVHEKPNGQHYTRTTYLPQCFLTGITGRADANGMAMETYNWAGSFVTGFTNPFHDDRAIPATRTSALTFTMQPDDGVAITSAVYTIAFAIIDGQVLTNVTTEATYVAITGSNLVTITTTEGYAIPAGAHIMALVYRTTPSTAFTDLNTDADRVVPSGEDTVFYVKGYQANIFIAPVDPDNPALSEQWLKVQSIDWNVDLRVETLRQIAFNKQGTSIYARVPTLPLNISANLSVTETDWADWKAAIVATKTPGGSAGNVHNNTYDFAPVNLKPEFAVIVEYKSKAGTTVQEWKFLDMRIDGYGTRASVGGRGEVSWTLRGTELELVGYNP